MPAVIDHLAVPARDPDASARFLGELLEASARGSRRAGLAFGNDPEARTNGLTGDPLGGRGRVYFKDPDGHPFEVCA